MEFLPTVETHLTNIRRKRERGTGLSCMRPPNWTYGKESLGCMNSLLAVAYIGIRGYIITRQPLGRYLSARTNIFVDYMTLR